MYSRKDLLYIPTVHMYHVMCTLHVYVEVLLPPRDHVRCGGGSQHRTPLRLILKNTTVLSDTFSPGTVW